MSNSGNYEIVDIEYGINGEEVGKLEGLIVEESESIIVFNALSETFEFDGFTVLNKRNLTHKAVSNRAEMIEDLICRKYLILDEYELKLEKIYDVLLNIYWKKDIISFSFCFNELYIGYIDKIDVSSDTFWVSCMCVDGSRDPELDEFYISKLALINFGRRYERAYHQYDLAQRLVTLKS